jgi:hypothetical protein
MYILNDLQYATFLSYFLWGAYKLQLMLSRILWTESN